jgi:anti-sigma B factor antagonist
MTASISQPVPLSVSDPRADAGQDAVTAAAGILDATLCHAGYGAISGTATPPGGPADPIPAGPSAALCEAAMVGGPALSSAGVAIVSLYGELDISDASVLQACLSHIRWQARARSVADLTGLAFIDCACLGVLVRHCKEIRGQGGSFALAGPQPAVCRILAITGLLTWFEVHGTVEEAVGAGQHRSPVLLAAPARPPDQGRDTFTRGSGR